VKLNNVYAKQPYLFNQKKAEEENEMLATDILQQLGYDQIEKTEFVDSTRDYDLFNVSMNQQTYHFKYSFDCDSPFFSHEYNILKQLAPFCPQGIKHGIIKYGDKIQYLLTSHESAENINQFGVSTIFEYLDSFYYSFRQLSNVKTDRNFLQYLDSFFARNDIDNLPEHSIEAIKDHSNINNLREILNTLKSEITFMSRQSFIKNTDFCHGNLLPQNILTKGGLFKFQNLHDGYVGNKFFDLCSLFVNIGIPLEYQRQIAIDFSKKYFDESVENLIIEYNSCYNLILRLFVYESIFSYLAEVYLYESSRPEKILQMVDVFLRNEEALMNIPSVEKHKSFLIRDIMEPLIGRDNS
jgi:hypothetical protein